MPHAVVVVEHVFFSMITLNFIQRHVVSESSFSHRSLKTQRRKLLVLNLFKEQYFTKYQMRLCSEGIYVFSFQKKNHWHHCGRWHRTTSCLSWAQVGKWVLKARDPKYYLHYETLLLCSISWYQSSFLCALLFLFVKCTDCIKRHMTFFD